MYFVGILKIRTVIKNIQVTKCSPVVSSGYTNIRPGLKRTRRRCQAGRAEVFPLQFGRQNHLFQPLTVNLAHVQGIGTRTGVTILMLWNE